MDPEAGRATVRSLFPTWLAQRKDSVAQKTYVSDAAIVRLSPPSLASLSVNVVTGPEVTHILLSLKRSDLAASSVSRYRASLSSFFAWAGRERLILTNPVTRTRVPKSTVPQVELMPFSEAELEAVNHVALTRDQPLANILLVAAWTGVR